jgi:hypothetical protein
MKDELRLKSDLNRKISFTGGFLVCVRIPLFCRRVGGVREIRCDFSRLSDAKERESNLVLFSRN